MKYLYPHAFTSSFKPFTELQKIIVDQTRNRHIRYFSDRSPEISAPINEITDAVESAYILTPKADLPKVEGRGNYFDVEGFGALATVGRTTAESTRKRGAAWLAIAQHLEVEEKAKALEEIKAKAAEVRAVLAENKRLNELADEWFGKDFADLGPNKAAAIKEIHRLETIIEEEDAA